MTATLSADRIGRRAARTRASYAVREIFLTLQGEGGQAGRAAVFCRFAGCNLWSGRERDRAGAICRFCDTDFVGTGGPGGGRFGSAGALADAVAAHWPGGGQPLVVCTGGEPLLQLDAPLIAAFHARGFEVAVETNGTLRAPAGIDWLCVSPKAGAPLAQVSGRDLKLVYPQAGLDPAQFEDLDFERFYLQPMDGPDQATATAAAVAYCLAHPTWRLNEQVSVEVTPAATDLISEGAEYLVALRGDPGALAWLQHARDGADARGLPDLAGKRIAVYTLAEAAGARAKAALETLYPGCRVDVNSDLVCTAQLTHLAQAADLFVFAWKSSSHQAFYCVKEAMAPREPVWAAGKGTASILRAVADSFQ